MGFYEDHCIYLPAMLGWFVFSAALSSYNKIVFGETNMNFPCPLLMTSIHFLTQWLFSYTITSIYPETHGSTQITSMSWENFLWISIPCGLVTAGDIGLSNLALVRISMTFYTMIKSSAPIFVVGSAYLFGIVEFKWSLIGVVVIIICGEYLTVLGEAEFDFVGFILCLSATILSGLRWTVIQLKLKSLEPPLKTTLATMRILSPSMVFFMVLFSLFVEKPWGKLAGTEFFADFKSGMYTLGLGFLGAILALCMIMCEFYLIMKSNAIVLMIGGVLKEIVTIYVGVTIFHDKLNTVNMLGGLVAFMGVLLYKASLYLEKIEKEYEKIDESNASGQSTITDADSAAGKPRLNQSLLKGDENDDMSRSDVELGRFQIDDDDDDDNNNHVEMSNSSFAENNAGEVIDEKKFDLPDDAEIS